MCLPALLKIMDELRNHIRAAVKTVTPILLVAVWDEFDYGIDI